MRYIDLLKSSRACPFCPRSLNRNQVIREEAGSFLLLNNAPYTRDHLLVVPSRHVTGFEKLSQEEISSINALIRQATRIMKRSGHASYSILLRQGAGGGRSVRHIHVHIIPDLPITNEEHAGPERLVLTDAACSKLIRRYKSILRV